MNKFIRLSSAFHLTSWRTLPDARIERPMKTADFDFDLPEERIALRPADPATFFTPGAQGYSDYPVGLAA